MKKRRICLMTLAAALCLFVGSAVHAQFTLLHSFSGSDGASPYYGAPVVDGSTLYGTANLGANGGGVVYSMNTDGSDYTVLHTFTTTASDGYQPLGSVVLSGSTLFGTTYFRWQAAPAEMARSSPSIPTAPTTQTSTAFGRCRLQTLQHAYAERLDPLRDDLLQQRRPRLGLLVRHLQF